MTIGAPVAYGCGIEWTVPKNHFDGVEEHGYVAYSSQIGEIDLADGLKFPVIIDFQSDREAVSPYIGHGWVLTLLESKIVQTGETSFRMYQPDGWYRDFWRSNTSEDVLSGQGGWKAKITGQVIDAYADCGWKLSFTKGKLTAITTPKNRRLDFIYANGRATEMREGAATRLRVEFDPRGEHATALVVNDERIVLEQDKRPMVQNIAGQNVISGMSNSLSKITIEGQSDKTFLFKTTSQVQPALDISNGEITEHRFVWDASTKRTISDGDWRYNIEPHENANAAIGRINSKGQREFWWYDGANGKEIVRGIDGVQKVMTWFTSGKLAGRTQKILNINSDGRSTASFVPSYDESGRLIRQVDSQGVQTIFTYGIDNRISEIRKSDGSSRIYEYSSDGGYTIKFSKNNHKDNIELKYDRNGRLLAGITMADSPEVHSVDLKKTLSFVLGTAIQKKVDEETAK